MSALRLLAAYWTVIALWIALNGYVAWRLVAPLRLRSPRRELAWAGGAVAVALPIAALIDGRNGEHLGPSLQWAGYLALGFASIVILFALVRDAVLLVLRALGRARRRWATRTARPVDPERRLFLTNAVNLGIVGTAGTLTGAGYVGIRRIPDVVELEVPIEGLPAELDGFRIAQLTDVHVGPTIKRDYVQGLVDATNSLAPDLVAITGDLVDGHVEKLASDVAPLAQLRARHGSFFVTGNHEYYWGPEEWIEHVRGLGVTVLLNEHRVIEHGAARLVVGGVTDVGAARHLPEHESDPLRAFAGAPAGVPRLLLAHQPRSIFGAREAAADLQLSGHTHGGQYFPFSVLVYLAQPFVAGLHRLGATWIYVSRGSGYWGPPLRVGAPSEITLVRLVAAPAALRPA